MKNKRSGYICKLSKTKLNIMKKTIPHFINLCNCTSSQSSNFAKRPMSDGIKVFDVYSLRIVILNWEVSGKENR